MVTAVAYAQVPKFTVVIGGCFGAGNYGDVRPGLPAAAALDVAERPHQRDGRGAGGNGALHGRPRRSGRDPREVRGRGQSVLLDGAALGRRHLDPADTRRVLALGIAASLNAPIPKTTSAYSGCKRGKRRPVRRLRQRRRRRNLDERTGRRRSTGGSSAGGSSTGKDAAERAVLLGALVAGGRSLLMGRLPAPRRAALAASSPRQGEPGSWWEAGGTRRRPACAPWRRPQARPRPSRPRSARSPSTVQPTRQANPTRPKEKPNEAAFARPGRPRKP